jgi:hypothetical protein
MNFILQSTLAILCLVAAVQAQATPNLGDKSVFTVNLTQGPQSMDGIVTFELTGFEKSTDSWTQITTTEFNGQKDVQKSSMATQDLLTETMIDETLANCGSKGGTVDTVTCAAGTFPACAVPVTNDQGVGTLWVAKVPFGYAKWISKRSDGVIVTGLLQSFARGQ